MEATCDMFEQERSAHTLGHVGFYVTFILFVSHFYPFWLAPFLLVNVFEDFVNVKFLKSKTLFCGAAVVATESIGPVSRGERGYFIG